MFTKMRPQNDDPLLKISAGYLPNLSIYFFLSEENVMSKVEVGKGDREGEGKEVETEMPKNLP